MSTRRDAPYKILFVCLGNICRSPAAEAVMEQVLAERRLDSLITVDSAGTADYHIGRSSDERMIKAGTRRGYSLTHKARQITPTDLHEFDLILAMDKSNLANVLALTSHTDLAAKVHLFLPYCGVAGIEELPDPYYGGIEGFEQVLDLLEEGCANLALKIKSAVHEADLPGTS